MTPAKERGGRLWMCRGCERQGDSARDLLAQGCEGKPEAFVPDDTDELREILAALRDPRYSAATRLGEARHRLSALLSDREGT